MSDIFEIVLFGHLTVYCFKPFFKKISFLKVSGNDGEEEEENNQRRSTSPPIEEEDILAKKHRRRRTDPKVDLCNVLDEVLQQVKATEYATPFLKPVKRKSCPDYSSVVAKPMDLSTIKVNLSKNFYANGRQFVEDLKLILINSKLYNGDGHEITVAAENLFNLAMDKLNSRAKEIKNLELLIDPLSSDDDLSNFCRELNSIVEKTKRLPKVVQLNLPEKRKFKRYFETVSDPIDLNCIADKCTSKLYIKVDDFLNDIEKIYRNSEIFNGVNSACTAKAKEIVDLTKTLIAQVCFFFIYFSFNLQEYIY